MSQRRPLFWPIVSIGIAILVVTIALPQSWKVGFPSFLRSPALHLGLDLAGGTQLDFRISEQEIADQLAEIDKKIAEGEANGTPAEELTQLRNEKFTIETQSTNLVEAIRTVLERRINALGVSEAVITPSYLGNEKHLLVECPGVVDVQECIKVVGKTIQLEFKEEFTVADDTFRNDVKVKASAAMAQITRSGATLQKVGQDQSSQLGVSYMDTQTLFRDLLPKGLESLWNTQPGAPVQREGSLSCANAALLPIAFVQQNCLSDQGQLLEDKTVPGIFLAQTLSPLTQTGRVLNEAPKAFAQLAKTETGAVYTQRENMALDDKVDAAVAAALRTMKNGELKAVQAADGPKVLFLSQLRPGGEQVSVSHILVSYKGAAEAGPEVTRTRDEAMVRANALKEKLNAGGNFDTLARQESDGPSKASAGRLGVISRGGALAGPFENSAFGMKAGQISDPVETQYGFHIIRADTTPATSPATVDAEILSVTGDLARAEAIVKRLQDGKVTSLEPAMNLRWLFFWLVPSGWKDTALDGKHFRHATVTMDPVTNIPVVQIAFDTEGARLFAELTKKNVGKRIAIYVGGNQVTAPRVNEEITGGTAVISGNMNVQEAQELAQDLNTGAIPAPIHLTGQYTIEATLGDAALQTSMLAGLIGIGIVMLYMMFLYRLLGVVANMALVVYAFLLFAILKLPLLLFTNNYIVLTLAGMAGIILSIGMAVDANVLVFERMKEELRRGRTLKSAVESGFKHAWPAIRDGNVSTIITCVILFAVGTSIVRGFAVTLGMGVILSLFTAITVTRWILRRVIEQSWAQNPALYGIKPGHHDSPSA